MRGSQMQSREGLQDENGKASVHVLSRLLSHSQEARRLRQRRQVLQGWVCPADGSLHGTARPGSHVSGRVQK